MTPVAGNVWQHVEGGSPAAAARRLIIARRRGRGGLAAPGARPAGGRDELVDVGRHDETGLRGRRYVRELVAAIEDQLTHHDADTGPFVWSTTVDAVLDRVRGGGAIPETGR